MIGSSSPPFPVLLLPPPPVFGGGGGGPPPPPLFCRLPPADIRRFIFGSLVSVALTLLLLLLLLFTLPRDDEHDEVIGMDADCWMRIFWEAALDPGPLPTLAMEDDDVGS